MGTLNRALSISTFVSSALAIGLLLFISANAIAQVKRVVIVKCDGVPSDVLDKFVRERDPRTGKSLLPWVEHIFYQRGTRLQNFYVRGMSLSAPSWSLLETGQHLQIKGNVEFDRYTLRTYDYLNFIPYVINTSRGARVDMPGAEVLDSLGQPMLMDAFPHEERYLTFSLFQRGPRFVTYRGALKGLIMKPPRELFDEWTMGFAVRNALPDQLAREMIDRLKNPNIRYLELIYTDFDHAAHHNNDRDSHLAALKKLDNAFGQIWTAIQGSPLADETAFIAVSDHGFNTNERVYSQGYNLVKLLGSPGGGGHHVITKRRPLLDYSIKGINPFITQITSTTPHSYYLQGQSSDYPTALLDFDGNERASIHLRDSDLNVLHILLKELQSSASSPAIRKAAMEAFFKTLEARRDAWQRVATELAEETSALRRAIERQRKLWEAQPKKFTREEVVRGLDDKSKRVYAQLDRWITLEKQYSDYLSVLYRLISLEPSSFDPSKIKIQELIPKGAMGERNSIYQLQNYVVGPASTGLQLLTDDSLDFKQSFVRVNYFELLHSIAVKNNVQPTVTNRPVDMIAARIPTRLLAQLNEPDLANDAVWVYGGPDRQALILARIGSSGELSFRYQPIRLLTQSPDGSISFEKLAWQPGLPLRIFEDKELAIPETPREQWLNEWHTDTEWLKALHKTTYSNGLIGLYEELAQHELNRFAGEDGSVTEDRQLLQRLVKRQRNLIETDMLIVANNHWNFDVRGFNPGGNHGSFFRVSTLSTLMVAGGKKTRIPQARVVDEPYDSLSFVPTVLALTGNLRDDRIPVPILWEKGFRRFPGRVISELLPDAPANPKIASTGVAATP